MIDWETFTLRRGNELLKTIETIQSLMNDLNINKRSCSIKFLYAVTRPPMPPRDEDRESDNEDNSDCNSDNYCDSDRLKEIVFEELKSNLSKLIDDRNDYKQRNDPEKKRLLDTIMKLSTFKAALANIDIGLFDSHGHIYGLTILKSINVIEKGNEAITKSSIKNEIINQLDGSLDQTTIELLKKHIDKIFQELEDKKVHSYSSSEQSRAKLMKIINRLKEEETKITLKKNPRI